MLGPVRNIKKQNEKAIVFYKESEIDNFCDSLCKSFTSVKRKNINSHKDLKFDRLATYIAIIPLIMYFFKEIDRKVLFGELKVLIENNFLFPSKKKIYQDLFNASIKYLLKNKIINCKLSTITGDERLVLSNYGVSEMKFILSNSKIGYHNMLHDKIRCDFLCKKTIVY